MNIQKLQEWLSARLQSTLFDYESQKNTVLCRTQSKSYAVLCSTQPHVTMSILFSNPLLQTIGRKGSTRHSPSTMNLICSIGKALLRSITEECEFMI